MTHTYVQDIRPIHSYETTVQEARRGATRPTARRTTGTDRQAAPKCRLVSATSVRRKRAFGRSVSAAGRASSGLGS